MNNYERIKQAKNIKDMGEVLSDLIYIAYTSKDFKSHDELLKWLESESEECE